MAGAAHEPAYQRSLEARAARLGVADRVEWLGHVDRASLPDLYREADALLFATKLEHEGQGLTYLEAMACGLPVVAHPTGGAREFLDRHAAVERVGALGGDAFAGAVERLARDPERQRALVEAGLDVVRRHGSLDTYVTELESEMDAVRCSPT
jgi:glycosyltransferase involved in cell wall biosynthesis